ncbi:MAG: hypothetical protein ACR2OV_16755 [Hyphomicrobiaceae bacterium]
MMHLEAIRLREVGAFREGCALEGIAPGLNLFVGPNELGKSTLFGALQLLFEEAYTANNKTVRRLQPNGGGAPFVECDFFADGRTWRLSKQFLAGRLAELRERDGRTVYRGGDVEPALTDLLDTALGTKSNLRLLWVAQRQSFEQPKPDGPVRQTLESLTSSEAEAAAGGGELASVHSRIRDQLFGLVTERARRPKAGGAYARALERRDELNRRWHDAEEKLEGSRERRAKLTEIEQQIGKIEEAARAGNDARRIEEMRAELEQAGKAKARLELSRERVDRLEAELKDAGAQLERLQSNIAEVAELGKLLEANSHRLAALTDERSTAERVVEEAEQRYAGIQRTREALNEEIVAAERQVRRHDMQVQLTKGKAQLEQAREAEQETCDLARDTAAISLDKKVFDHLSKLRDEIAALEAQIEVTAGRVRLAYTPGAAVHFEVDGVALADGAEVVVDHVIRIVVPELGEIVVSPGGDGSDLATRLEAKSAELADLLGKHGAASYVDAMALWETKRELVSQHQSRTALLDSLAPGGKDQLEVAVRELEAQIAALGDGPAPDEDLSARIANTVQELEAAAQRLKETREHNSELREDQVRLIAERDGFRARMDVIRCELPPNEETWQTQRAALVEQMNLDGERRNAAVRELDAWREAAPEQEQFEALTTELAAHEKKQRQDTARLSELREERRALDGAMRRDLEDGVEADANDLREQVEAAQNSVERIEVDIAALSLLDREVGDERARLNRQTAGPVAERVNALVAEVIPQSRLEIDSELVVSRIGRVAGHEAMDQLSDGTREQISVLSRLALAGIFADGGHAVPLVLDDALVFSDDDRLVKMFELLGEAARVHQVIVLTCHGRSFAPLVAQHGARELSLIASDVDVPSA